MGRLLGCFLPVVAVAVLGVGLGLTGVQGAPRGASSPVAGVRPIRGLPEGEAHPVVVTREAAFQASPREADKKTNCHTARLSDLVNTPQMLRHFTALQVPPDSDAGLSEEVTFCYYRFLADDFSLLGTQHRPALSEPHLRASFDKDAKDLAKFGLKSSYVIGSSFVFGDAADADFTNIQGFIVNAVPSRPYFRLTGQLNATSNTRPVTENQVVQWKVLYSPSGDVDAAMTLDSGQFTVFRKSALSKSSEFMQGNNEIASVHLHGFESGWVGVWVKVAFEPAAYAADSSQKSCKQLGWEHFNHKGKTVCGASKLPDCNEGRTFQEAQYICKANGARLCTWTELNDYAAQGSGCGYDAQLVWTSSRCVDEAGAEGAWAQAGNPERANEELARVCKSVDQGLTVRCCADAVVIPAEPADPGAITISDSGLMFDFAEPSHPAAYAAAKLTAEREAAADTPVTAPGERSSPPPPEHQKNENEVAIYDFSKGTLANQVNDQVGNLVDIGAECEGKRATFVDSIVRGKLQKVLRFEEGGGLSIPDVPQLLNTDVNTAFTISMLVKLERSSCFVRLLNVNSGEDNGLYLCDGLQAEVPAGHALKAMQWHHITVSTTADKHTKLYVNGNLLKSWTVGRTTWKTALMIQHDEVNLFNDCGKTCRCDSTENSAGWVASIHVFNHAIEDDEVLALYNSIHTGVVADYDLTAGTLESVVESAPDLVDIGASCQRPTWFEGDASLNGVGGTPVLRVPQGAGVHIPVDGLIRTGDATEYTLLLKMKLPSVDCRGRLFVTNHDELASDAGLYACGTLQLFPEDRIGPLLRENMWHVVVVSTTPSRETSVYLDGLLVRTWVVGEEAWEKALRVGGDAISIFTSAHSECDGGEENIAGSLSRVMLFDRALGYDEVQYHVALLGNELKYTADPELFGGSAPLGAPCSFPFVANGQTFTDCTQATNLCKVSGSVADDGEHKWGYCAPGAGFAPFPNKNIPAGFDIGECRGGVVGCQRACTAVYDCVGFAVEECPHGAVQRDLLRGLQGSVVRGSGAFTVVSSGEGGGGGAQMAGVAVEQGKEYVWTVGGVTQQADQAYLFVSDAQGSIVAKGPSLPSGTTASEVQVKFTARGGTVNVGVRFAEGVSQGDTVRVERVDLPRADCDGKTGSMATGMLKGQWREVEESATHTLYHKVRLGPVSHLDVPTLANKLQLAHSLDNATLTGTGVGAWRDIGESCDADHAVVSTDVAGHGGEDAAGFSLQYGHAAKDAQKVPGALAFAECLDACVGKGAGCKAASWDASTAECKVSSTAQLVAAAGSVGAVRRCKTGAKFLRLRQTQAAGGGGAKWTVEKVALFTDFGLQSSAPTATVTASSGEGPQSVADGNPTTHWQATATADAEWLAFDFGPTQRPTVRSVFVRSRPGTAPQEVSVEESDDGQTWRVVAVWDDVEDVMAADLLGAGGGVGGKPQDVVRSQKGAGLALDDVCHLVPCVEDGAAQTAASYSVVLHVNMEGAKNTPSPLKKVVGAGAAAGSGLYVKNNRVRVQAGTAANAAAVEGGTFFDPYRWRSLALSASASGAFAVNAEGNSDISGADVGLFTAALQAQGEGGGGGGGEGPTLRVFSEGGAAGQCSARESNDQGTNLLAELAVYNRALSVSELEALVEGMRTKCGGEPGECSDHGYCRDGRCVCERAESGVGWKGAHCEKKACPGIPECGDRGACRADGTCQCDEGFQGEACELATCPGEPQCSGHGTCEAGWDVGTCTCDDGFRGADCSLERCPGDYQLADGTYVECSGRGRCVQSQCECDWHASSAVLGYQIVTACEGQTAKLECSRGVIRVQTARFGRSDTGTCGNSGNFNCRADSSYMGVVRLCENKPSCEVAASNGIFGDPCPGTGKYLKVSYSCVAEAMSNDLPGPTDCSMGLPVDGLVMYMDAAAYSGGDIPTRGSSGASWTPVGTTAYDGVTSWNLDATTLELKGGAHTFGQHYATATWVSWRETNSGWRTLLRNNADHQVLVQDGSRHLGMYSNRNGAFRGVGTNVQMGWHLLYTKASANSPTDTVGWQQFYETRGNVVGSRYRGSADRTVAGTTLMRIGWPGQGPGKVSKMFVWNRHLAEDETIRLWDMGKREHGFDYRHLGCFADDAGAPLIPTLEGDPALSELLPGAFNGREDPVDSCARAARRKKFLVFALQEGGKCMSSGNAEATYSQRGKSEGCGNLGSGGNLANNVYKIIS